MSVPNLILKEGFFPFSVVDVFDVVIDVERYPEFLPWCKDIKIVFRDDGYITAYTRIAAMGIDTYYNSGIKYSVPTDFSAGYINVQGHGGIFKELLNAWSFTPHGIYSTFVKFSISFQLKSFFIQSIFNGVYKRKHEDVMERFCRRVREISVNKKL